MTVGYFWIRTNLADGTTAIALDVDGRPGEYGQGAVALGTLDLWDWRAESPKWERDDKAGATAYIAFYGPVILAVIRQQFGWQWNVRADNGLSLGSGWTRTASGAKRAAARWAR